MKIVLGLVFWKNGSLFFTQSICPINGRFWEHTEKNFSTVKDKKMVKEIFFIKIFYNFVV